MATKAKGDTKYQMIMNEVLKDTKKDDIKPTMDANGNVKPHILQDYKNVVELLKVMDVGETDCCTRTIS